MDRNFKRLFIAVFIFSCFLMGVKNVYANDSIIEIYDGIFENNQYTLYTDNDISDDNSLFDNVEDAMRNYGRMEYYNDYLNQSSIRLTTYSCDYDNSKCKVNLVRDKWENGEGTTTDLKQYNLDINIVSNISAYFPMVLGDDITINYDESMFLSEQEKENYINNYFNSLGFSSGNSYISFSYSKITGTLYRSDHINGNVTNFYAKRISNIVFSYSETPYSDEFKALTSGTLTIKSDSEINSNILDRYLLRTILRDNHFQVDGNIVNNKVFIKRIEYPQSGGQGVVKEKHLVTLATSDIDLDVFDVPGYRNYIDIAADEPTTNRSGYISRYLSARHISVKNDAGGYDNYSNINPWQTDDIYIMYEKGDKDGFCLDIQFHKVDARFLGYSETISENYANRVGTEYEVRADELNENTISQSLTSNYSSAGSLYLLGCNDDYSVCDISLYNNKTYEIEIHKVNIVLNNTITDEFKHAFKIKENGKIDIQLGEDVPTSAITYYNYYDEKTNLQLYFNCSAYSTTCELRYNNNETHRVEYDIFRIPEPSKDYSSKVKREISVYPGESDPWSRLNSNFISFAKDENNNYIRPSNCNSNTNTCAVAYVNSMGYLEIHNTDIIINEGRSPEFDNYFPGDTIKLNSIYTSDTDIYRVSLANLMSKTNTWSFIDYYDNGQGTLYYNQFEAHKMNVEFEEGVPEHKAIVDQVIENLGTDTISVTVDDLDYINDFYYTDQVFSAGAISYNSKVLNETLKERINNNHISYFLAAEGGVGMPYNHMNGGKMVLYYDGIAYGISNNLVEVGINNVIYIPDNTLDTREAYIAAAQKRIDDYLGKNSGAVVSYGGDANGAGYDFAPLAECDGNYYILRKGTRQSSFLIIKDSSRMKTSTFSANDVINNITVDSDNANYPTNTIVSGEKIDEEDNKYQQLINKLKVDSALIFDIHLYSPTIGNINDFNGIDFDVTLPIFKESLLNKELYAYFIKDDGTVEEHPITLNNLFGKFKTGHFSTYVISEKSSVTNVTETKVEKVTLDKDKLILEEGQEETLEATVTPSNASDTTVTWKSNDESIATVENGKVKAIKEGTTTITASSKDGPKATCKVTVNKKIIGVKYTTHVQSIGWQSYVANGEMAGTSGKSLRLEGIKIKLSNIPYEGSIEYRTQVQDIGWQAFVNNDTMSGTSGQSKRLEAIEIRLTGEVADHYDIYYRVHAQDVGWMTWASNGERSGTEGYGRRLEGIEIVLVEKGQNPPERTDIRTNKKFVRKTVTYRTHVQDYGWQESVADGAMSGTSHESKRLEGIEISLYKPESGSGIEYRTHVQDYGWQDFVSNGAMSGTSHEAKRLEAIEIRLTGDIAETHDVYYRVHAQNFGWMGWAKNGESAGTAHYSYRLEGIEIVVVEKGENPPERTDTRTPESFKDKNA